MTTALTAHQSGEWQSAAMWCARRGYFMGCPLPQMLSAAVADEIANHPEEWLAEIQLARYALARFTAQRAPSTENTIHE